MEQEEALAEALHLIDEPCLIRGLAPPDQPPVVLADARS
jgi:hypothetical protein